MVDFTYAVFLAVASLIGSLITLFAVGVLAVLLYDSHHSGDSDEQVQLPRAA